MISASVAAVVWVLMATPDAGTEPKAALREGMVRVAAMLPLIDEPSAFRDRKNQKVISTALESMSVTRHMVAKGAVNSTIKSLFESEIAAARAEFARDETEAARFRLRGLTAMCMGCHVRVTAPNDTEPVNGAIDRMELPPLRRANLYVATRQFAKAEKTWQAMLSAKPATETEVFDQASVLRTAVIISTRVNGRPADLVALLEPQSKRTDFPPFVQRSVKRWLEDARAWAADPKTCTGMPAAQALSLTEALLTKTAAASRVVNDDDFLVPNMRAAACAQAVLETTPPATVEAPALFFLAVAISTASEPALWQLDVLYLERCIELVPHTAQARACVARLSDRLGYAFTGNGGLPSEYGLRLRDLRTLASEAR
jgi:hypothetical protein